MGFHRARPFAVIPTPVLGLAGDNGQDHLTLEESVKTLSGGALESRQNDVEGPCIQLGAHAPIARPHCVVLVYVAKQQMQVQVARTAVTGM